MSDVGNSKMNSMPTPAEKTGGPPSGVGGPQDNSGVDDPEVVGINAEQQIEERMGNEDDMQSPTLSPSSPDVTAKMAGLSLNSV